MTARNPTPISTSQQSLPQPAVAPTSSPARSNRNRSNRSLSPSPVLLVPPNIADDPHPRLKRFWTALKDGIGYSLKQPEWSQSLLELSASTYKNTQHAHGHGVANDPSNEINDATLEDDELYWISGQNGEPRLALVLVERDHSATSQSSPLPGHDQDNADKAQKSPADDLSHHLAVPGHQGVPLTPTNQTAPTQENQPPAYRLKGYEQSIHSHSSTLTPWMWVAYRLIPWVKRAFVRYCYPEFHDERVEKEYAERVYNSQKFLAFVCSTWMLISWAIAVSLIRDRKISDAIFFYAVAPVLTTPLPFMVFYNVPRKFPIFYQFFLTISIWSWACYGMLVIELCGYYGSRSYFPCGSKDMMNLFYYYIALPVIALFGLGQQRLYATIAPLCMIITPAVLFTPRKSLWARYAIEHLFLQALLLYIHWRREILERNVFYVNKKIRDTLINLNHARAAQSRIEAARARSTGYIFHEVRQPLTAATLAYQNLAASTIVKPEQRFEWDTLRNKLNVMSKLLNDVLDQKRMDAGKFEIVSRPYAFHDIVRQSITSARVITDRNHQEIIVDLDKNIDLVARINTYHAQHKSETEIYNLLNSHPNEDGIVLGDETRLSQVLNNLISNSTKFTEKNGKIRVNTRLVSPATPRPSTASSSRIQLTGVGRTSQSQAQGPNLFPPESHSLGHGQGYSRHLGPSPTLAPGIGSPASTFAKWEEVKDRMVIRVEVEDTGCGITANEVRERRLFSPYAQAGVGRYQGGAGTGLGLSLVRRIVKLMGGRMGVDSEKGSGTTFWFELPLKISPTPLPPPTIALPPPLTSSPMSSYQSKSTSKEPISSLATSVDTEGSTSLPNMPNIPAITAANFPILETPETPPLEANTGVDPLTHEGLQIPLEILTSSQSLLPPQQSYPSLNVGTGISVLLADDEPVLRTLLKRLLARLGCEVQAVDSGDAVIKKMEALRLLSKARTRANTAASANANAPTLSPSQEPLLSTSSSLGTPHEPSEEYTSEESHRVGGSKRHFDVIILDHQMPGLTGLETLIALRKGGVKTFIVGLTGDTSDHTKERFRQAGANEVLYKPVLEAQIRALLLRVRELQAQVHSQSHSQPQSLAKSQVDPQRPP